MKVKNPIFSIVSDSNFHIPLYFSDDQKASYLAQLKNHFAKIYLSLNKCGEEAFRPAIKEDILSRVQSIQFAIIDVITEYLDGHPSRSYILFKVMLERYNIKDEILKLQQIKVAKESIFFRMQPEWDTDMKSKIKSQQGFINLKEPQELFHPPFQKRRSVSTNRFSISGYPCLYLSKQLPISFSECFPVNAKYVPFNAIALKNIRPLYFIDMTDENLQPNPLLFPGLLPKNDNEDVIGILNFLGIYQLILSSHTKISYQPRYPGETFYFKAEYIIPQLILQWLKLEGFAVDGIRYKSCTAETLFPKSEPAYNFVLPVQNNLENGFCPSLTSLFEFSPVFSTLSMEKAKDNLSHLNNISIELAGAKFQRLKRNVKSV